MLFMVSFEHVIREFRSQYVMSKSTFFSLSSLQSVKILGDKLVELQLTRSTVSEVLRIFLESHGYDTEVCNTLRTKTFHSLPPDSKAAILGFLVEELNSSNVVTG